MKSTCACVLLSLLATSPVWAASETSPPTTSVAPVDRPTEASIHRLLDVMQARKIIDTMTEQMDSVFDTYMSQFLKGKQINDKQREVLDKARARIVVPKIQQIAKDTAEQINAQGNSGGDGKSG